MLIIYPNIKNNKRLQIGIKTKEKDHLVKGEKLKNFYSLAQLKKQDKYSGKKSINYYRKYVDLHNDLRNYIRKLNKLMQIGVRPNPNLVKEFSFRFFQEDKENKEISEEDKIELIKNKLKKIERDMKKRLKTVKKTIKDWEKRKRKMLAQPWNIRSFFGLQFLGYSLIRLSERNFNFHIKYYDPQVKIDYKRNQRREVGSAQARVSNFTEAQSEYKLQEIKNTLEENMMSLKNNIKHWSENSAPSLDYVKYLEMDLGLAYRYMLYFFKKEQRNLLTAGQIVFCSYFTNWDTLESSN